MWGDFIYTRPPRRRGLRLLAAISTGYAFSLAPSLLLSAKKRRYALDFSRARLRKAGRPVGTLSLRGSPQTAAAIRTPSETQGMRKRYLSIPALHPFLRCLRLAAKTLGVG